MQTNAAGAITTLAYDKRGRKTAMTDPAMGVWAYAYNAFGELISQTDSLGQTTTMTYDVLGRLTQRAEPDLKSYWYYDKTAAGAACGLSKGKLCEATTDNGYRRTHSYDTQGRITRYRQGNGVITNKTYSAANGRLNSIQAAKDGSPLGSVQNNTYQYDTLSNLKSRSDQNTGVAETFAYDSLNRLSTYTVLGGALSPPTTIDTRYDARGNLVYKSDVGRYWYDPARPNRLTNITLENHSGAVNNTGTRALSYVFDDYRPDAKSVNGVPLGNGNLMYTVSHDAVSGKHSARFETYTSFNMPKEIKYSNIGATVDPNLTSAINHAGAATGNPAGITSDRTLAFVYGPEHQRTKQTVTLAANAPTNLNPGTTWYLNGEDGQSLTYEKEIKTIRITAANGSVTTTQVTEHKHYLHVAGISVGMTIKREGAMVTASATPSTAPATLAPIATAYSCPAGYSLVSSNQSCTKNTTTAATVGYGCIATLGVPTGANCVLTYTQTVPARWGSFVSYLSCNSAIVLASAPQLPAGATATAWVQIGQTCTRTITNISAASAVYSCPAGQALLGTGIGSVCQAIIGATPTYSCPAGYTLQSAGCVSTATGGASLQALSTRYFHTDHLGSITAVTDEMGAVVERMAYDAWGKRRFTNGTADRNDTIVGLTTDRGYTEHEELDEIGVIHMNGRIYDPYIGRFMSADPYIQAPYELQSHNRYAYVMNNPLLYTDPSGYFSLKSVFKFVVVAIAVWVTAGAAAMYLTGAGSISAAFGAIAAGVAAGTGTMAAMMVGAVGGFVGGFLGAAVNGASFSESLKAGVIGGITGAAFAYVGQVAAAGSWQNYLGHALVGCGSSVASGGGSEGCARGAASALIGKAVTNHTSGNQWNDFTRGVAATVSGGVTSRIMGGTFASGAQTAAMGYLFNHCSNPNNCTFREKISTWFEGSWSVAEGTGNGIRHIARGVGLLGTEELERFNQEGAEVDKFAKLYNQDSEFRREVNKALTVKAAELNTEEMKWRINGRAVTGIVTGFGPAALIGDTTRAVENGHSIVDALIKGGLPGTPGRKP